MLLPRRICVLALVVGSLGCSASQPSPDQSIRDRQLRIGWDSVTAPAGSVISVSNASGECAPRRVVWFTPQDEETWAPVLMGPNEGPFEVFDIDVEINQPADCAVEAFRLLVPAQLEGPTVVCDDLDELCLRVDIAPA